MAMFNKHTHFLSASLSNLHGYVQQTDTHFLSASLSNLHDHPVLEVGKATIALLAEVVAGTVLRDFLVALGRGTGLIGKEASGTQTPFCVEVPCKEPPCPSAPDSFYMVEHVLLANERK